MTEVLWHGRGGRGAFSAAKVLGAAYSLTGKHALAFPSFGPERRGLRFLPLQSLIQNLLETEVRLKKLIT